jgi:7-cyano-7-deazaguanine synthase in queuosine biosynthesis
MNLNSNNQTPEVLLMFSGGLDSTGAFWRLLQDGRKIHVHHMNLKNVERRHKAESVSVKNILTYMRTIGDFIYSESSHEYPPFKGKFMWDSDIVSFVSGSICLATPWIKEVAIGRTKSDDNQNLNDRVERAHTIFSAFTSTAKKVYPVGDLTKQEIYDMLPKDLRKLTWSCRTPVYSDDTINPCGVCQTCKKIGELND